MKKVILLFLVGIGLLASHANAQIPAINQNVEIFLDSTDFYLDGSYQHEAAAAEFIFNPNRTFYVSRDLTNNATHGMFAPGFGQVYLYDTVGQRLLGNPYLFYDLTLDKQKDTAVFLQTDLQLDDTVSLGRFGNIGKIEINQFTFDLTNRGTISGESDSAYIFSTNGRGEILYRGVLNSFSPADPRMRGLGLDIGAFGSNFGNSEIIRRHNFIPDLQTGFVRRNYEIRPRRYPDDARFGMNLLEHEINTGGVGDRAGVKVAYRSPPFFWDFLNSTQQGTLDNIFSPEIQPLDLVTLITAKDTTTCSGVPAFQIAPSDTIFLCEGDTFTLDPQFANLQYDWSTGEETQAIQVTDSGQYRLDLFVLNGCRGRDTVEVILVPRPKVGFTFENVCNGEAAVFTDTTTLSLFNPADTVSGNRTYFWDFGDGTDTTYTVSYDSVPPVELFHQYADTGTYEVRLIVTTPYSCPDSSVQEIRVHAVPEANFAISNLCALGNTAFTDLSTSDEGFITYAWDFGDGETSSLQNPLHTYQFASNVTATLVVTSEFGCADTATQAIEVLPEFRAGINFVDACIGREATYFYESGDTSQVVSYQWSIRGGITSTDSVLTNVYERILDEERVSLFVESAAGCLDTVRTTLSIGFQPNDPLQDGYSTCGDRFELNAQNSGVEYFWSTGDSTQTIEVTQSGTYTLLVDRPGNCVLEDTTFVRLNSDFEVDLGGDRTICSGEELDAGEGESFQWNIGAATRTITITASGQYGVEVTDQNGCVAGDTVQLTVLQLPEPDLGEDIEICPTRDTLITLDPQVDPNFTFTWSTDETSQTIQVSEVGTYSVLVSTNEGCEATDTLIVRVLSGLDFSLPVDTLLCTSTTLTLDPTGGEDGFTVNWTSEAGLSLTQPTLDISEGGTYTLEVISEDGCTVRDTLIVTEPDEPISAFFLVSSTLNVGDTALFVNLSTPQEANFNWDFGDGNTSVETSPLHIYAESGTYDVSLLVEVGHCRDSLSDPVTVAPSRVGEEEAEEEDMVAQGPIASMEVYPNPTNGAFILGYQLIRDYTPQITVYDQNGRKLYEETLAEGQKGKEAMDLQYLPRGMYIIRLEAGGQSKAKRLIIGK
ncbi:MAG: PKD domain-containing protein [Bacteroidota bacterium]